MMKNWGIKDVAKFPFPNPIDEFNVRKAEHLLSILGALDPNTGTITEEGKLMAKLPITPRLSKMCLTAAKQGSQILMYTLTLVAGMTVGDFFIKLGETDEIQNTLKNDEEKRQYRGRYWKLMQVNIF